jgi:hypothetical protein
LLPPLNPGVGPSLGRDLPASRKPTAADPRASASHLVNHNEMIVAIQVEKNIKMNK